MYKRSIGSDGTFAHGPVTTYIMRAQRFYLRLLKIKRFYRSTVLQHWPVACTNVLSQTQTTQNTKVPSLSTVSVAVVGCVRRAQRFAYMHIFATIARFCTIFKIIHIPVERQGENNSNDIKITLQMLYPDGKNNSVKT